MEWYQKIHAYLSILHQPPVVREKENLLKAAQLVGFLMLIFWFASMVALMFQRVFLALPGFLITSALICIGARLVQEYYGVIIFRPVLLTLAAQILLGLLFVFIAAVIA